MGDVTFLWSGWGPLARIVLVAPLGYLWLALLVRASGQRTLAKMTPFDFVLTVTLGSVLGRVITARSVAVTEILLAFAVLIALQWAAATARARGMPVTRWMDADPALLYHRGELVRDAMRRHRINERDLLGAVREKGMGSLAEAEAIVLEADGKFAVIGSSQAGDRSAIPPSSPRGASSADGS